MTPTLPGKLVVERSQEEHKGRVDREGRKEGEEPEGWESIFERISDVAVIGTGFIGFSAVRALARSGLSVAWLEPSGDLLWEASRALEDRIGGAIAEESGEAWATWVDELRQWEGVRNGCFDPVLAEVLAAREALRWRPTVTTVFHAVPVAVQTTEGERLASITVATKAGLKRVAARRWIDATESGQVAALCMPAAKRRSTSARFRSMALQAQDWAELEPKLRSWLATRPGASLLPSARCSERRLVYTVGDADPGGDFPADRPWHREALDLVRELRDAAAGVEFLVSHLGWADWPVYARSEECPAEHPETRLPANLLVLSPAWNCDEVETVGNRFAIGAIGAERLRHLPGWDGTLLPDPPCLIPEPAFETDGESSCDVLVAGAGTAGAIAAIAAARQGVATIALDFAAFPGGIGSGGGISSYFHGAKGGLFEETDARTARLSALLGAAPGPGSWHHDAKKLAILEQFEEAGVVFRPGHLFCGVERDSAGMVRSVLAAREGRVIRYRAKAFIDSTGDGDLCALAGAAYVSGRPGDGRTLSFSQVALFLKAPTQGEGNFAIGILNYDAGWADATDPEDFSRARLEGVSLHLYADWPAQDRPFLIAPLLGVRQSRQISTEVQVTLKDLIHRTRFGDVVGCASAIADTHSVDFEFESDRMLFYLWGCRCFEHPLECELPYRMLLPIGLQNVWIACRAAGVEGDAAYCLRMQRDMQKLGEVAGLAAAFSVERGGNSREPDWPRLRQHLETTGMTGTRPSAADHTDHPLTPESGPDSDAALLASLDAGDPGIHLWKLAERAACDEGMKASLLARMDSASARVSFYAALVLGFVGESQAEPRLMRAIREREIGLPPGGGGAFGQTIDVPFWVLAVALLRRCGTSDCFAILVELLSPDYPFNVRTIAALTIERLAKRHASPAISPTIKAALEAMFSTAAEEASLAPSRSLWKTLQGAAQNFASSWGVDTRQDHSWQLALIAARTSQSMGWGFPAQAEPYLRDQRAYVHSAFAALRKPEE